MTNLHPGILIVGAGASGLTLARGLESFGIQDFEIFDKARGVGGRMASRRLKNAEGASTSFDTGFQQIESQEAALKDVWKEAEAAEILRPLKTKDQSAWEPQTAMSALAKFWAGKLSQLPDGSSKLHLDTRVTKLSRSKTVRSEPYWEVISEKAAPRLASFVVLSCPLPQALELLPAEAPARQLLSSTQVEPAACLLWTKTDGKSGRKNWSAPEDSSFLAELLALDSASALLKAQDKARQEGLLPTQDALVETYLHRWRYSRVRGARRELWLEAAPGLFLAGDAFAAADGRTDVERSVLSGRALAEELASRLRPAIQPS